VLLDKFEGLSKKCLRASGLIFWPLEWKQWMILVHRHPLLFFSVSEIKGGVLWSMQPEPYALCTLCQRYSGMSGSVPTIAKLPPKVLAGHIC